jgi:hypothetical protein
MIVEQAVTNQVIDMGLLMPARAILHVETIDVVAIVVLGVEAMMAAVRRWSRRRGQAAAGLSGRFDDLNAVGVHYITLYYIEIVTNT